EQLQQQHEKLARAGITDLDVAVDRLRERAAASHETAGELTSVVEQAQQQEKDLARLDTLEQHRTEASSRVSDAAAELTTLAERIAELREQHATAAAAAARVTDLRTREQALARLVSEATELPTAGQQAQRAADAERSAVAPHQDARTRSPGPRGGRPAGGGAGLADG